MNDQTTPIMKAVCKQSKICHNKLGNLIKLSLINVNFNLANSFTVGTEKYFLSTLR